MLASMGLALPSRTVPRRVLPVDAWPLAVLLALAAAGCSGPRAPRETDARAPSAAPAAVRQPAGPVLTRRDLERLPPVAGRVVEALDARSDCGSGEPSLSVACEVPRFLSVVREGDASPGTTFLIGLTTFVHLDDEGEPAAVEVLRGHGEPPHVMVAAVVRDEVGLTLTLDHVPPSEGAPGLEHALRELIDEGRPVAAPQALAGGALSFRWHRVATERAFAATPRSGGWTLDDGSVLLRSEGRWLLIGRLGADTAALGVFVESEEPPPSVQ